MANLAESMVANDWLLGPDPDPDPPPDRGQSLSGSFQTPASESGPFRSIATPILAYGDANFGHSTRGSAPTPNRRVSACGRLITIES